MTRRHSWLSWNYVALIYEIRELSSVGCWLIAEHLEIQTNGKSVWIFSNLTFQTIVLITQPVAVLQSLMAVERLYPDPPDDRHTDVRTTARQTALPSTAPVVLTSDDRLRQGLKHPGKPPRINRWKPAGKRQSMSRSTDAGAVNMIHMRRSAAHRKRRFWRTSNPSAMAGYAPYSIHMFSE